VSPDNVDVIIVGGGLSGSAIARTLASAGVKVTVLEQGPWIETEDIPTDRDDWEFAITREWSFDPNVRQLPQDYPVSTNGYTPWMFNAVGGSTNHYGGFWHRMKPVDFRKGTEHGLEDTRDWPISYEDLAPYYDRADEAMGISGLVGDPAYPPRDSLRLPPLRHGRYFDLVSGGLDQLGWHWWPADNAIISEDYNGRQGCNLCGYCDAGCPRRALSTGAHGFAYAAVEAGADFRTGVRATRIVTDAEGRASGVEYTDLSDGSGHAIEAPVVVLACNAVGSPRLLMLSADDRRPDGLGNSTDQVGRYLHTHGYALADLWLEDSTEHFKGPLGAALYSQEFYDTDPERGAVNGITMTFAASFGPALISLGGITGQSMVPWGADHHAAFDRAFDHHLFCAVQSEDLPRADNRITLDLELVDSSGLQAPRIHYELHENDRRLLEFGLDRVRDVGREIGAYKIDVQPLDDDNYSPPGWHPMGTCRMGDDPAGSVVDSHHRVWDTPGLLVCDMSSFVTGGAGNPAATVAAMALRCADQLLAEMKSGERPAASLELR
jgi:choline dehydrogenase-like flavoprotein